MKAVVLAYHNIGCEGIRALRSTGYEITMVLTHPDDPGENTWFESVAELCAKYDIPCFAPDDINHPLWIQRIRKENPDILFSFFYRKMIGSSILDIPRKGCLNLHASLLPKYRGRAPVNWAIIKGEKQTGVTLHHMTPKPDEGDIVAQKQVEISSDDTGKSLHLKLAKATGAMLEQILPGIKEGNAPRTPQDPAQASYFGGRRPEDGEINWSLPARDIRNLVRAVTKPYPGAFTFDKDRKCYLWAVSEISAQQDNTSPQDIYPQQASPGTILSTSPLVIACGEGAISVDIGQCENSVILNGSQLAKNLKLTEGKKFGPSISSLIEAKRKKRVLILGVNGFIGSALSERILESEKYLVSGMDLRAGQISHLLNKPGFTFEEGDISIHREWIEYNVRKSDIVIPLVAIATPIEYTRNPLRIFELDFEENIRVIRYCAKYRKRVLFPSTSEVYGMCSDNNFDEDNSNLVLGPIRKQRWIYSCCKQLIDRVIWAYGERDGLKFTLFRPFNWLGPRLDSLKSARVGSSRAITQLILNLTEGTPIELVDGGEQKRCFTDVVDGVEALYRIIENRNGLCNGKIINIGNPDNEASIRELADLLIKKFEAHPLRHRFPPFAGIRTIESSTYYGKGYQDIQHRKPSIENARRFLDWKPTIGFEQSVEETLDFFLRQALEDMHETRT